MSNTLRDLVATSFRFGKNGKGVLTSEEAFEKMKTGRFSVISNMSNSTFFFTDDHCFGHPVLPKQYVPSSMSFPMHIEPRPELPDGLINTVERYIEIFEKDFHQITSIEELANIVDAKEPEVVTKTIKWQPEHFPVGTVVIMGNYKKVGDEFHFSNNGGAEMTVMECVNNGPDNWLIRTDTWNESLRNFYSFNFDHVTGIKSRGTGPVKFHKHPNSIKEMPNLKRMITNDPINKNRYYSYYFQDIVNYLIRETGFINNLYIYEGFFAFFFKQTFVYKTGKDWNALVSFDKKRAKRFVRQNVNRWIKPMKEVRFEEKIRRNKETDEYYRDMEDEWDRDFDARHPELIEEPTPVPADHFYGLADSDEVESMQNDDGSPKVNHF